MTAAWLRSVAILLLAPAAASAHRLDEYLQAARIAVDREQIIVELDLTPGTAVAARILSEIDRDGDGAIVPHEAEAYGRDVVTDLVLTVNGRAAPLRLTDVVCPTPPEMFDGLGTIRLRARASTIGMAAERMAVRFTNNHAPVGSVHLVNALKPGDRRLVLEHQTRDVTQREIALEYRARAQVSAQMGWSALALVAMLALIAMRQITSLTSTFERA